MKDLIASYGEFNTAPAHASRPRPAIAAA